MGWVGTHTNGKHEVKMIKNCNFLASLPLYDAIYHFIVSCYFIMLPFPDGAIRHSEGRGEMGERKA